MMVWELLLGRVGVLVDTQDLMSATASININEEVTRTSYRKEFAPKSDGEQVFSLVKQVVEKPLFTLKSHLEDIELRFQIEDRIGVVGLLKKGDFAGI